MTTDATHGRSGWQSAPRDINGYIDMALIEAQGDMLCDEPDCDHVAPVEMVTLYWLRLRGHSGEYVFCSTACLRDWATAIAGEAATR